jgi:prophage regulatory protein
MIKEESKRLLRLPAVKDMTGLSKTTIYDLIKQGKFPDRIKVTERASRWKSADIDAWIDGRVAASHEQVVGRKHQKRPN